MPIEDNFVAEKSEYEKIEDRFVRSLVELRESEAWCMQKLIDFSERGVKKFGGGDSGDEFALNLTRSVRAGRSDNELDEPGKKKARIAVDEEDRSMDIKTRLLLFAVLPLFYVVVYPVMSLCGRWSRNRDAGKKE